jgi:membrane protease YdiL (CAAX protease family)
MAPQRLLMLALAGEGLLVAVAVVWSGFRDVPLTLGPIRRGLGGGVAGAGVLAVANGYILCRAPAVWPVRSIRRLFIESIRPLFDRVRPFDVVAIGVAAGVGEEFFFRGVLQPELGLVAASVIFGLLHTGGRDTLVFGVWVTCMGAALGALAIWAGGLLAPIVAHAVYDAGVLAVIRWGRECPSLAVRMESSGSNGSLSK